MFYFNFIKLGVILTEQKFGRDTDTAFCLFA